MAEAAIALGVATGNSIEQFVLHSYGAAAASATATAVDVGGDVGRVALNARMLGVAGMVR